MDQFFIRSRLRHQDDWRSISARTVHDALALARAVFPEEDVEVGGREDPKAPIVSLAGTIGGMVDLRYEHHPIERVAEDLVSTDGPVLPRGRDERLKLALDLLAEARPEKEPRFIGSALGGAFNNWSVITNPGRAWAHGSGPNREAALAAWRAAAASVLLQQKAEKAQDPREAGNTASRVPVSRLPDRSAASG